MSTDRIEIYASPTGSPFADGSHGYPVNDLHTAMALIRRRREPGQRAVVWMAGGEYRQSETLVLTAEDSFTTFAAADAANPPVISGSVPVTGWREVEVAGAVAFAARAPQAQGRCLYVDGRRAPRPRFPREGFLKIAEQEGLDPTASFVGTLFDGADRFRFAAGDFPALSAPDAVEVVVPHYWVQERMPIASVDYQRCEIVSDRRSIFALRNDWGEEFANYYLDNVIEAFGEAPGEWYLDATGALVGADGPHVLYRPLPGEDLDALEVRMPVLDVFVDVRGTADAPVREIRLEGVGFVEADFAEVPVAIPPFGVREDPQLPEGGRYAAEVQAASTVPGALAYTFARSCAVVDASIERVGGYGIALGEGCRGNLVSGTRFRGLGAGAVRSGGSIDSRDPGFNRANEVSDCDIAEGGRVYPSCVAVLFMHGAHNVIAHNRIHDFFYTGISVGWMWDYLESPSQGNRIVGNHISNLGQGLLNDMGGIYLLGIAPGTELKGNHIHDVRCENYGGWGIYLDEGSSHVIVEGNVVHDVSSHAFHQHYGREVIVRNNIWAYGHQGQVSITRPEPHVSFTFERNIVLGDHTPGFMGQDPKGLQTYTIYSDLNLFWDLDPIPGALRAGNGIQTAAEDGRVVFTLTRALDEEWATWGYDRHSVTADPLFIDAEGRDFRVREGSPAEELGIRVPDVTGAGPRPVASRRHPLAPRTLVDPFLPTQG